MRELTECHDLLCYFIEKHGQGRVDALFALFQKWLLDLLAKPKTIIQEPDEMVEAMQEPAARSSMSDPAGATHTVVYHSPGAKPPLRWRLEADGLQIEKTYCVRMNHHMQKICGKVPLIRDCVFPDRGGAKIDTLSGISCTSESS